MFQFMFNRRLLAAALLGAVVCGGGLIWLRSSRSHLPIVSAWSWFSGPRAITVNSYLLIGSVDEQGYSRVDVINLDSQAITDSQQLSTRTEVDDHNNPALLSLDDNYLLAAYARHGRDEEWFSRLGELDMQKGTIRWEEECAHANEVVGSGRRMGSVGGRDGEQEAEIGPEDGHDSQSRATMKAEMKASVTYCNLMRLAKEDNRIYNFFRGLNFNPCFCFSDDDGQSWSAPEFLMKIGDGQVRPYVKYFGNGTDRIDFLYTEAHPRNQDTSIYHCYYQAGGLFQTNGEQIGSLPALQSEPLHPLAGTRVFDGTSQPAWVWDLRRTNAGELIAVFVVSHDGAEGLDLRYYYATATNKKWNVSQIAYAGKHLYEPENHYAGGIVIDAIDPQVVYASSNVDPTHGTSLLGGQNRIYRGVRDAAHGEFRWTPLGNRFLSGNQIRPFSLNTRTNSASLLLWLEGSYHSYTDYRTHVQWLTSR